jgi:hypothetical protein
VFPLLSEYGFVPVTPVDVVSPGDNIAAKIEALLSRSTIAIADFSTFGNAVELRVVRSHLENNRICVVVEEEAPIPTDLAGARIIRRPSDPYTTTERFFGQVREWLESAARELREALSDEPTRLLVLREYRAAVISAFTLLETSLRRALTLRGLSTKPNWPLNTLLAEVERQEILSRDETAAIAKWRAIRNNAVHTDKPISMRDAQEVVEGARALENKMRRRT